MNVGFSYARGTMESGHPKAEPKLEREYRAVTVAIISIIATVPFLLLFMHAYRLTR